jgi:hypothetical protein
MLVETFEATELDHEGTPECEAEALELINSLGLEGQRELLTESREGVVRCPYRKMTQQEAWAYGVICPKVSPLKKFSDGPIPVRVLQVAAHANGLFDEVEVWSAKDADIKDPVLVGIKKKGYERERFLLARWGDELLPFGEVLAGATVRFKQQYKAACSTLLGAAQSALTAIDSIEGDALYAKSLPSTWTSY